MKRWWTEVSRTWMGPVARHHAWRHENRMYDDDHHAVLHELLCEILRLAKLGRGGVGEVKKNIEAKKAPDNSEFFLGRSRRTGWAVISKDLLKWVSEKATRDSAILKKQRKAAEERALLKGGNKK
jgi:hypothetical protein